MEIVLLSPRMHGEVNLLPEGQYNKVRAGERTEKGASFDWRALTQDSREQSFPLPIEFEWRYTLPPTPHMRAWLFVSERMDFSQARVAPCEGCRATMENLCVGKHYYWKIALRIGAETLCESPIGLFSTTNQPPRLIHADGLTNVRDVGGWPTRSGRAVRQGLLYRGSEMDTHRTLTEEGRLALTDTLKIKTDLDLRGEATITASPLGVRWAHIPVKCYGEFCAPEEFAACRAVFSLLADEAAYPIYMHCWGGADRTGTIALLLGGVLGMDDESLLQDYELTSFSVWGIRSRLSDAFVTLLDALNRYGEPQEELSVKSERFLLDAGVTPDELDSLRRIFL